MDNQGYAQITAEEIINKDNFIRWLNVKVLRVEVGYSKIEIEIREEMLNGLGIAHGGILFALADSAFALAANSRHNASVAWEASINFMKPVKLWDVLTAETKEIHHGKNTGLYLVTITDQRDESVALFKGSSFRLHKEAASLAS